jgi:soluble lytic murein transglycosylase
MKRTLLVASVTITALGSLWLGNVWLTGLRLARAQGPQASIHNAVLDPYDTPLLQGYRAYRDALIAGDPTVLAQLARRADDFLAYRSAMTLAEWADLDPATRLALYLRAAELRVHDPLARKENREFHLGLGAVAEAAGDVSAAVDAYAEALPHDVAVAALARLEEDPYRLSNHYFRARLHEEALDALGDRHAPSIEAPAYRSLGEHKKALDAYERWLALEPGNLDALYGRAWSHFYLADMATAKSLFEALPGSSGLYARALIVRREGDLTQAVNLMRESGNPDWLWLASGWLEAEDRYEEALSVYLAIAPTNSAYADDSAYRAFVLAGRLGDDEARRVAGELVPAGSFFALRMGGSPQLPTRNDLKQVVLEVQDRAAALARVGDLEAAVGELIFALRKAAAFDENEAEVIALAEALQSFGEFRQSQRAAQRYVSTGSVQLRTWLAAYPRAYRDSVLRAAQSNDLDPSLVWAIMRQESAFYPKAVSTSNAAGLMQVVPSTWNWLAELQDEEPANWFDPEANIRYGTYYLGWLMEYHEGDAELTIPSYNRGQGYIRRLFESTYVNRDKDEFFREIDALETREYLQRVTVNLETYRALYEGDPLALRSTTTEQGATGN